MLVSALALVSTALTTVLAKSAGDSTKAVKPVPLVTFVELGSVNCIPCKKMQPVMKSIEERYGDQIKVIFYDISKPQHREQAVKHRVQAIPTQVFLDAKGNEFFRHMGYFNEESIDKLLQKQGLTPISPIKGK